MIAETTLHLDFFWPSAGELIWELAFWVVGIITGYVIAQILRERGEKMWCTKHKREENKYCQKCEFFEFQEPDMIGDTYCIWLSPAKGIDLIFV